MYNLTNICLIIDLDGFTINKIFRVREMGFCSITKQTYGSFRFNLSHLLNEMNETDWKTVCYLQHNLHGLTLEPHPEEQDCLKEKDINKIILQLYEKSKTAEKYVVGYKGGTFERDLLEKLQIPYLNLEDFGCPKFEHLSEPQMKDCGFHIKIHNVHCPMKECVAFAYWLYEKLQK